MYPEGIAPISDRMFFQRMSVVPIPKTIRNGLSGWAMKIRIQLFAGLRKYAPEHSGAFFMEMSPDVSRNDLIRLLQIPYEEEIVVLINGRYAKEGHRLHDGDSVAIFPPMTGG